MKWISVEDRLPKKWGQRVLTYDISGYINMAVFDLNEFYMPNYNITKYVTHWMPLPEPPELNA